MRSWQVCTHDKFFTNSIQGCITQHELTSGEAQTIWVYCLQARSQSGLTTGMRAPPDVTICTANTQVAKQVFASSGPDDTE